MVELSFTKKSNFDMWKKLDHLYMQWMSAPISDTTGWTEYLKKNYNCNIVKAKSTYINNRHGGIIHRLTFETEEQATLFLLANG